jgi:nitroimidazol reductase NimA-like FMN-containing flavoprotein (pyridoxamine 5'-phosphate oxidase superfamily)
MRRKDKEITGREDLDGIINRAQVCRLGLCDGGTPYIVPMSFGYDSGRLYFHGATEGRKIEVLRKNPRVCFELEVDAEVVRGDSPCNFSMRYRCVMGEGTASLVEDPAEKKRGLEVIMQQYGDEGTLPEGGLDKIAVIRVDIETMTGKKSKI